MPIPPDLRPTWKIASILLILKLSSRGAKSSLKRLHIISWALRSEEHQANFMKSLEEGPSLFRFQMRFEPALSRAIDFATADGMVDLINGDQLKLTDRGDRWLGDFLNSEDVMGSEKNFLQRLGKNFTEKAADLLIG